MKTTHAQLPEEASGAPRVSVLIISYNQEKFIAKTVGSALMQATDFDFEIVIGDDFSTDGTRDILKSLLQSHPRKIRLLLNEHNLGANRNLIKTLEECQGKYVALLEGDDLWLSQGKLQKQAEFLDGHPYCSICFHDVVCVDEHDRQVEDHGLEVPNKTISNLEDLLVRNFMHTCSVMFRKGLVGEFPEWFFESPLGDWPLHVFNAQRGQIGYIPETLAAYRVHPEGVWSSVSKLVRLQETLKVLRWIDSHLDFKYTRITRPRMAKLLLELALANADEGKRAAALLCVVRAFARSPLVAFGTSIQFIKRLLQLIESRTAGRIP